MFMGKTKQLDFPEYVPLQKCRTIPPKWLLTNNSQFNSRTRHLEVKLLLSARNGSWTKIEAFIDSRKSYGMCQEKVGHCFHLSFVSQVISRNLTFAWGAFYQMVRIFQTVLMANFFRQKATRRPQTIGFKAAAAKRPHFAHGCSRVCYTASIELFSTLLSQNGMNNITFHRVNSLLCHCQRLWVDIFVRSSELRRTNFELNK